MDVVLVEVGRFFVVMTIRQALNEAIVRLKASGSDSPKLDAQLLLMKVCSLSRIQLLVNDSDPIDDDKLKAFNSLVQKREEGHPIAHLIGERDFWDLTLKVTPDTLIPRPDTEIIVEQALNLIKQDKDSPYRVLDLGTGSGAIILSLKNTVKSIEAYAIDKSPKALQVAKENAERYGLEVSFLQGSWFEPLANSHSKDCEHQDYIHYFDVIVSNPPYIEEDDEHLTKGDVRFEPLSALVSGKDGLDDIRLIAKSSIAYLKVGGYLLLEHGYNQGEAVQNILKELGYDLVQTIKDYGNNDRVTMGRFNLL